MDCDISLYQIIDLSFKFLFFILGAYFVVFKARIEKRKELGIKLSDIISNNILECTILIEKIRLELCIRMEVEQTKLSDPSYKVDRQSIREISFYRAKWYYHSSILPSKFKKLKNKIENQFAELNKVLNCDNTQTNAFLEHHNKIVELQREWNEHLVIWGIDSQEAYELKGGFAAFKKIQ